MSELFNGWSSRDTPLARAATMRARFVMLFDPGGRTLAVVIAFGFTSYSSWRMSLTMAPPNQLRHTGL